MSKGYDFIRFNSEGGVIRYHNKRGRRKIISTHIVGSREGRPMWLLVVRDRWWKRWFKWW